MLPDFLRDRMAKLLAEKPELRQKANCKKLLDELNDNDIEANWWSCHVQIDNDLWVVVPSMPKNAPNLIILHKGQIAVEFGGFFCERLIQFHLPADDNEEPAVQEPQSLPPNSQ
ncbi:unnamed protein product [Cladocopium goreaui]|uniref:Helix-turn-helix domain-containing protein n=1 Tax=Cladocopium goreaui TaxID=2562237 RepID=A0A9P1GHN0_9DINO|nr:unnamed protein product [Cladocopium goreaui]